MISLKRYLDAETRSKSTPVDGLIGEPCSELLAVYRAGLVEMAERGAEACPHLGLEVKQGMSRILENLGPKPETGAIRTSGVAVCDLLRKWGKKTAEYYEQKAGDVKDLLLVMTRTAEALGHKDDQYAKHLDAVTSKLESIATLNDISKIRASVETSAYELRNSIARMTAESKAVIDHLRVEVSTYQAKLERAEYVASCDALTGLGSRLWIEGRIQQRIESDAPFCVVMIDVAGFRRVNDEYGNMVGDLVLKEFARELRSACRFTDIVGRWGGDEFVIVLDCKYQEAKAQVARLQSWICGPYHVPGRSEQAKVRLDIVFGVAEYRTGDALQELLERADSELCAQRAADKSRMTA